MGVQVVYDVDNFKNAAADKFYEEDSFLFYGDIYMGQKSFFNPERAWFDNKALNMEAVEVLDFLGIPYERV